MIDATLLLSDGATVVETIHAETDAQVDVLKVAGAVFWRGRVFVRQQKKFGYQFAEVVLYIDS